MIDAKNSNVYAGLYSLKDNKYTLLLDNMADNINVVLNKFVTYFSKNGDSTNIVFVGDGSVLYKEAISNSFSSLNSNISISFSNNNIQSSISLAKAGFNKYLFGEFGDSAMLTPLYLRKSQAERYVNGEK